MAGPLSGIAGQQQVPIAQPAQQNQNTAAVRPQDQQPEEEQVQPQGTAAAESQSTGTDNNFQQQINDLSAGDVESLSQNAEAQRGSLVDVLV